MIVDSILEFVVQVFDRGIPNQERIALYLNEDVNIGRYGLMLGLRSEGNMAIPIKDNMLWFGDAVLNKGDWIFVYTGPGEAKSTDLPNSKNRLYSIHWGRDKTILQHEDVVPILFRIDAVQIPEKNKKSLPK